MSDVSVRFSIQDDASSKLTKISSTARSAATQLQQMGKQIDSAFTTNSPNQFASTLGSAMSSAEGDVSALGNAIDDMESSLSGADLGGAFDDAAESASELADSAEETGESLEEVADQAKELGDNVDDIGGSDSGLDDLGKEAEEAGTSMEAAESKAVSLTSVLKTLFATVSAAAVLKSVGSYVSDSIETGTDYTSMISEVQAISGADSSEMATLEATAREYGATTVFSASEAAEALKYMSLAGWSATESTSALGGVLDLAAASGMELGEASDMVTDYLSAFGMEADQATYFADMLTYAQANSNTSVAQLSEAYQNSAANMNAYGQDVETTTSLLEAMANQGYKGARAGTSLAAMMRDITNNMEDGSIMIGETAVAVEDAEGNFRDLTDILKDVETATSSMGDAEKAAALSSTFTSDSIKGVNMVLAEGVDTIAEYEEELRNASGTASDMADTMNDNLAGDKAAMNSAWEELELQTYEAMEEPMREAVQYVTDTVIPTLTEWVPEAFESAMSSISAIGNAIKSIFETILKNPKAISNVLTTLGTAFVAMKGVNTALSVGNKVTEAGGLVSALGNLSTSLFGSNWALGAAAVTAAVAAVAIAVDDYNNLQIENNLEEHFGTISLGDIEVEALAAQIVPVEITAQMELANVAFDEADELIEEAESLLAENQYINWKLSAINILTDEDAETLLTNSETFVTDVTTALEKQEYGAELTVKALLGEVESESIVSEMQSWFQEDHETVESLGAAVTDLLQSSIDAGVYNINTATAVEIMQQKMLDLVNGAKKAELQGKLDWLTITSSGAALDADSWSEVVTTIGEYQDDLVDSDTEAYQSLLSYLRQLEYNDPSRSEDIEAIREAVATAYEQTNNMALSEGWSWIYSSMTDAYGDELSKAETNLSESTSEWLSYYQKEMEYAAQTGDSMNAFDSALTNAGNISGGLDSSTKGALLDRYQTMLPTVEELEKVIDSAYGENGEQLYEIPTAIMEAYNQAMEIGAAAGDEDATYAYMAQQIAASYGSKEDFISELEAAGLNFEVLPEALQEGINRAFTETSDDLDYSGFLDGLVDSLAGEDVDWTEVESLLNQYGLSIASALEEQGIDLGDGTVPLNADGVEIDTSELAKAMDIEGLTSTGETITLDGGTIAYEYTVDTDNTMSGIAEAAGVSLEALEEANQQILEQNGSWDLIYPGDIIYVPDVDTSEVGEAMDEASSEAQEAADAATGDSIETDQEITVTYSIDDVDAVSGAAEIAQAAQEAADTATETPVETEQEVNTTLTQGETDASALEEQSTYETPDWTIPVEIAEQLMLGSVDSSQLEADTQEATDSVFSEELEAEANALLTITQENNSEEVYSEVGDALDTTFLTIFPVDGDANVTVEQENNSAEVYSQVGSALTSAFATSFGITANAVVTLNYALANPTASISFGGAGSGSSTVTASIAGHAAGGAVGLTGPELTWVGEEGLEYIIPTVPGRRERGIELWTMAGQELGTLDESGQLLSPLETVSVDQEAGQVQVGDDEIPTLLTAGGNEPMALHATGGYFDYPHLGMVAEDGPEYIIPIDGSDRSMDMVADAGRMLGMDVQDSGIQVVNTKQGTEQAEWATGSVNGGTRTINVNINGTGEIQVSGNGASKEQIVEVMIENLRPVFMEIVQQEIIEEGDGTYEW